MITWRQADRAYRHEAIPALFRQPETRKVGDVADYWTWLQPTAAL